MILKEGQELKSICRGPITGELLKAYAAASLDPNPIHLDPDFAKKAGYPSVIAHGMLSMAFMADGLCFNFPSSKFEIKKFSCRFKKVTFPGDVLSFSGKIKKVTDQGELEVLLSLQNQKGEITAQGEARIKPEAP